MTGRKPWESRFESPQYREARAKNRHDDWSDRDERSRTSGFQRSYAVVMPMKHAVVIPAKSFNADRSTTAEEKMIAVQEMLKRIKKINYGYWGVGNGGLIVNFHTETQASAFRLMCPLPTLKWRDASPSNT